MIASGGLSGGISSSIAGGSFWKGVREGLITSGLNHVAHMVKNYFSDNNIDKVIKEYEANEKKRANNSIKAEALSNFTKIGQIENLIKKSVNEWNSWGADVDEPTKIISELSDALLALGITATSSAPQIKIAAGILLTGLAAENLYLEGINNFILKPKIIRNAPNYAYNKKMMTHKQEEQYFKNCNCGGQYSGGGTGSLYTW